VRPSNQNRAGVIVLFAAIVVGAHLGVGGGANSAAAQAQQAPSAGDGERAGAPEPVVVELKGGQRLTGELVRESDQELVIRIAGVETTLPRSEVSQVIRQRPLMERYRSMRAVIHDDDHDRLLLLAEWLRANGLLEESLAEIGSVLAKNPNEPEGIRMRKLVLEQIDLRERQRRAEEERANARAGRSKAVKELQRPAPGVFPLLSEEEANLLKVYEVDLSNPPKLLIERVTVDRLLNNYPQSSLIPITREGRDAFHRQQPADILRVMFSVRARELYPEVRVISLPESLQQFRDSVNSTWLVNSCGTTACHGGVDGAAPLLFNRSPSAERSFLTNFLILERSTTKGGAPLINYVEPELSPLIQMGLPQDDSAHPHPVVEGWRPIFRRRDARRIGQVVDWIKSMHLPRPDYPIDYTPPAPKAREVEPSPDR